MQKIFKTELEGKELIIETGEIAQFANGSCLVRYGDTVILCTATASREPKPGIDFFPLSVDYEEKLYSVGKIPGGFIKREGRPSEKAVLTSRAIDRPMRPLFPSDLRNDVSVNNLVLSVDQDYSPEIAAMIGSSIAVSISDIPWNGPTASVQIGLVDGNVIVNPNEAERAASEMSVILAGTKDKICMIEAGANEIPDDVMLEAIMRGHKTIQSVCAFIETIVAEIGKPKFTYESSDIPEEIMQEATNFAYDRLKEALFAEDKSDRDDQVNVVKDDLKAHLESINPEWTAFAGEAIYKLEKKAVRYFLFHEHKRVDGRGLEDIRELSCNVGLLPRVHGSGFFQRGQTQVLTSCTLASLSKVQKIDGLDSDDQKRYMHHYNFPAYSVGEARGNRSPGRREIGHGALAERSLIPVLPSEEEFPYAIRTVSEITMSNGSTSQGAVCASTLALMDAGVPIKRPVAGISTGLIVNEPDQSDALVFMDIQGIEDFFGDMDFKVAGTTEGITSIQVDIKTDGLSYDVIKKALELTKRGRLQIINEIIVPKMPESRQELSQYAPKILQTSVPVDKIRDVIGQGGKVINRIIADTGVEIDITEEGNIFISTIDLDRGAQAISIIQNIINDPEPGAIYEGKVTRLMNFGAFVEIAPGKEGMVHISKIAWKRVEKVEDYLKEGDIVKVKVLEVDDQNRVNLSIRDLLEKPEDYVEPAPRPPRSNSGNNNRRFNNNDRRRPNHNREDKSNEDISSHGKFID